MSTTNEVEILLVEDNPRDADLTVRVLKNHHLANHVRWVKDGAEALDYLFPPDSDPRQPASHVAKVILLDLKLPKVDGLEVLRRLKTDETDERTRMIPVVILTSSREERDVVKSYGLGVNSYIVKPVAFDHFAKAVAQLGQYWLLLNQAPEAPANLPAAIQRP
jgi:CheY-like chemotaxis protein